MVNLAIIGCGAITTARHAPECKKSNIINLLGVFDLNEERCRQVAKDFGCKAYGSFEEVLNDSKVDGVIICVNNTLHCQMAIKAFEHNKHVLCEKPLAVTLQEAQLMIDTAKANCCYLMTAHNQRLCPANQKAKQLLESGEFGNVISFRTEFSHAGPEAWSVDKTKNTWFFNKNKAGLGALGDIGIHKADLIRWLLGDDVKFVTASVGTLNKKDSEGNPILMEDNAFAILETVGGIKGSLEASWTHYGKITDSTQLNCENGIIEIIGETKLRVYRKDGGGEYEEFNLEPCGSRVPETFAECILKKEEPLISGVEGLKALQIVLACVESSNVNKRIEL